VLHLARQCGLGLYHVELLCERSNCFMAEQNLVGAEKALREALERALDPGCLFLWGAAMAEERLGAVLLHRQRRREARATLKRALALQRKIGDPRAEQTERLLCRLEPGTTGG
jgi:tetratricopeptide (TPR) repeat protein